MNNEFDIMITGGQASWKGNIFRIATVVVLVRILLRLSRLGDMPEKEGYKFESGMAVKAIQNELRGERI